MAPAMVKKTNKPHLQIPCHKQRCQLGKNPLIFQGMENMYVIYLLDCRRFSLRLRISDVALGDTSWVRCASPPILSIKVNIIRTLGFPRPFWMCSPIHTIRNRRFAPYTPSLSTLRPLCTTHTYVHLAFFFFFSA